MHKLGPGYFGTPPLPYLHAESRFTGVKENPDSPVPVEVTRHPGCRPHADGSGDALAIADAGLRPAPFVAVTV